MERRSLNAESLSGRQLSVALMVAGLSPAAAQAGVVSWIWLMVWSGIGVALAWISLRRVGDHPMFCGVGGGVLSVLYKVGAVVLSARGLERAAGRLELTSGGSPKFWLLVIFAIPLLWICWGKAAPFFRMTEILWLAMAMTLALVIAFGLARVEWQYVFVPAESWQASGWAVCEMMAPSLFLLPYIYKVQERRNGRGLVWISALGIIGALLSVITAGILGGAAAQVPHAFYVAAGLLGKSARCEGLLSVLWLLPDLTLACLLCRVWGSRRWPVLGGVLAFLLALTGLAGRISQEVLGFGVLVLWVLTLLLPGGKGKIVVKF